MPRIARLDAPGLLHHVMIRGIERRAIFRAKKTGRISWIELVPCCPITELGRAFGMTPAAVGYAVSRGKETAEEKGYSSAKCALY
jgi:hypothetical protein